MEVKFDNTAGSIYYVTDEGISMWCSSNNFTSGIAPSGIDLNLIKIQAYLNSNISPLTAAGFNLTYIPRSVDVRS